MEKTYKFRIYPNNTQKKQIAKTFGCVRFVYNYYLDKRIQAYKENKTLLTFYDCCKDLTNLKKELVWLKEPDKCALQNALKNLDYAYRRFFKGISNFPKYKSKKSHAYSYKTNYTHGNIQFLDKHIKLPKLGWIKVKDKRVPQGRILNVTISQEPSGKYYVFVCCTDIEVNPLPKTGNSIGLDLGIKEYAIASNGVRYENPKLLAQSYKKLSFLEKELCRKTRGSSNWEKARIKLARQYDRIKHQRNDFLQKISTKIIRENDVICVEDLKVKEMLKDFPKSIRRGISDVSWGKFYIYLQYKANWYGRSVIKVDRYFASSQTCNNCGRRYSFTKNLKTREWICPNCKSVLDRDLNAAINILNEGLKQII